MYFLTALSLLPALAWAMSVTSPAMNATWDLSQSHSVSYSTVNTDPTTINIVLTNQNVYPSVSITLGTNINVSSGSYSIPSSSLTGIAQQYGYRIDLISSENGGILAQSGMFTIEGAVAASSSSSASSASSSSSASSASSSSASSSRSSASASSSSAAAASSSSASASASGSTSASASTSSAIATQTANVAVGLTSSGGVLAVIFAGISALLL